MGKGNYRLSYVPGSLNMAKKGPQQSLRVLRSHCHKVKDLDQEKEIQSTGPLDLSLPGLFGLWALETQC